MEKHNGIELVTVDPVPSGYRLVRTAEFKQACDVFLRRWGLSPITELREHGQPIATVRRIKRSDLSRNRSVTQSPAR